MVIASVIVALGFFVNSLIIGIPAMPSMAIFTRTAVPAQNAEHKTFIAERTPLRETASEISWTSYTPKRVSNSTVGAKVSEILRLSRQNTAEAGKARSATV
jgi:hypothetical protein